MVSDTAPVNPEYGGALAAANRAGCFNRELLRNRLRIMRATIYALFVESHVILGQ
jgi:hypothetical protein